MNRNKGTILQAKVNVEMLLYNDPLFRQSNVRNLQQDGHKH